MTYTKRVRCFFRLNSAWAQCSAICMGLSIFIRAVYYLGIMNFNDLTGTILAIHVILPVVLAAAYLIMLRGLRFNSPMLMGALACGYAISYLLITDGSGTALVGAALLVLTAGLLVVTGMGVLTTRIPLLLAALATLAYRVIVIDWMHCFHAPEGFRLIAYLPELSNFFGLFAILVMCPSVRLVPIQRTIPRQDVHEVTVPEPVPAAEEAPEPEPQPEDDEENNVRRDPEDAFDNLRKNSAVSVSETDNPATEPPETETPGQPEDDSIEKAPAPDDSTVK